MPRSMLARWVMLAAAVFCAVASPFTVRAATLAVAADAVWGQTTFTVGEDNRGFTNARALATPYGMAEDAIGGLFLADAANNRVVYYAEGSTTATRVWGQPDLQTRTPNTGGLSAQSLSFPTDVMLDAAGNLLVADRNNNRIVRFPSVSGTLTTTADREWHSTGTDTRALSLPSALAFDRAGNMYVADSQNSRVVRYPFRNGDVSTTADHVWGQPSLTTYTPGLSATGLYAPTGLGFDRVDNLYVVDQGNNRVVRFPAVDGTPDTVADMVWGQANFTSRTRGINTTGMYVPGGLAFDTANNLFVAERGNNRVVRFPAIDGTPQTTADRVWGQLDFTNGSAGTSAMALRSPSRLLIDQAGGMVVADQDNQRLLRFAAVDDEIATTATVLWGQPDYTTRAVNANVASSTTLAAPSRTTFDADGNLYVADTLNNRVLRYPAVDGLVATAADQVWGQPDLMSTISNSGGLSARSLNAPTDLVFDVAGNLLVVDRGNHRVLRFSVENGAPSTVADGVWGQPDFVTAVGDTSAQVLWAPESIAFDGSGNMYVSDRGNHRILRFPVVEFELATTADRVWGQPNFVSNNFNNGGLNARSLLSPSGITFDAAGNLFVADGGNNRILRYPLTNGTIPTTADLAWGKPTFDSTAYGTSAGLFWAPRDVEFDSVGNMYVADTFNNRVLRFANVNHVLAKTADTVWGQPSMTANTINTGGMSARTMYAPVGVTAGPDDTLYVADTDNARVLHIGLRPPPTPPSIVTQPRSIVSFTSGLATLSVEPAGTEPFTYRWYQGERGDTTNLVGERQSLTTPTFNGTTRFWVRVTNGGGSVDSAAATVTVIPAYPLYHSYADTYSLSNSGAVTVTVTVAFSSMAAPFSATVPPWTRIFLPRHDDTMAVAYNGSAFVQFAARPSQLISVTCDNRPATIWYERPETTYGLLSERWTFNGTSGADVIAGTADSDTIVGGDGADTVCGSLSDDLIDGGAGDDKLIGHSGNDTIRGGDGADLIIGYTLDTDDFYIDGNTLEGGAGDDTIIVTNRDTVRGGSGFDIADALRPNMPFGSGAVRLDLGASGIERAIGTSYSDTFTSSIVPDGAAGVVVNGGGGDDVITGSNGPDKLYGESGNDTIDGGGGNDLIDGADGWDTLRGGAGNDTLMAGNAFNMLEGGPGNDVLEGGLGDDTLRGGDGNDTLRAGEGKNSIDGGAGADTLEGGQEADQLIFDGDDTLVRGGGGFDEATAMASPKGVTLDVGLAGIEQAIGSEYVDTFTSSRLPDSATRVLIYGRGGDDRISGSSGPDKLYGEVGNDTLGGGDGNDMLDGDVGNDSIQGGGGNDALYGGAGADRLYGEAGIDTLQGEADNDTVYIDAADTLVRGGKGYDLVSGFYSTSGITVELGANGIERVQGSSYADTFTSSVLPDGDTKVTVYAGAGNDTITGSSGNDLLYGENGDDQVTGAKGDDTLQGGAGADAFSGGAGTDRVLDYKRAEGDTRDATIP